VKNKMGRFDTPESLERKKALANRPSWRTTAIIANDLDSTFKLLSKSHKLYQQNITSQEAENNINDVIRKTTTQQYSPTQRGN
jgi:hypothetical protein